MPHLQCSRDENRGFLISIGSGGARWARGAYYHGDVDCLILYADPPREGR
jgi:hypothetical protein